MPAGEQLVPAGLPVQSTGPASAPASSALVPPVPVAPPPPVPVELLVVDPVPPPVPGLPPVALSLVNVRSLEEHAPAMTTSHQPTANGNRRMTRPPRMKVLHDDFIIFQS